MIGIDRHGKSSQSGFSLIELMISLVLGLLILGLMLTVYLNNMQSSRFQNGMLRVQENGRFALDLMSRTVRMAGYDHPVNGTTVVGSPITGVTDAIDSDLLVTTNTGIRANTDIIAVTFEGGTGIRDCEGEGPSQGFIEGSSRTSQYAILDDFTLVCLTSEMNDLDETALAEGVEDMQVLYGLDPDGDGVANKYVGAGDIGVGNWGSIASVEITLLVNSVVNVLPTADNVCIGCVVFAGNTDNLIRGEFQTIAEIRNKYD